MISFCLVTTLAVLVFVQGGYFSLASCLAGVTACVAAGITWLRGRHRSEHLPVVSLLIMGLLVAYATSAIAAGASLTTLGEAGSWAVVAAVSLLAAAQGEEGWSRTLRALAWCGVATSVAGMLVADGLLPVPGGTVENRLQFTYQYANAAAAWYAACTWLCLLAPDSRLRRAAFFPAAALMLTQSGGALVAFVAVAVALGLTWARAGEWGRLGCALSQGAEAAVLFAVFRISPLAGLLLGGVLGALAVGRSGWMLPGVMGINMRKTSLALLVLLVVAVVAALVLMPARMGSALNSLVERGYQIRDGIALWSTAPLLGIGPDNWQYLYPYVQTYVYSVAVVHSSAVQLLLDVGVVGALLLVAACTCGLRGLRRDVCVEGGSPWSLSALCAAAFLLAHSLVEFDLQFSSLACLLALLLSGPAGPRLGTRQPGRPHMPRGALAGMLCLLVCLPLCVAGLFCAASITAIEYANRSSDYGTCVRLYEGNPLARADAGAQDEYLRALFWLSDYVFVGDAYEHMSAPSSASTLYSVVAANAEGDTVGAAEILSKKLRATPYDTELLEGARRFEERFGIDPSQRERFDAALQYSEGLVASSEAGSRQKRTD